MTDLGTTIDPKSDQLNSDDLITGPRTIKITKVSGNESSPEQPVSIYFEGDNGKPWKPGKSMRRVLVQVWGRDSAAYIGRSVTIYRDPSVKFGGLEVGGIRLSHMSDIDTAVTMALTATRASRKPFTVKPLVIAAPSEDTAPTARSEARKGRTSFLAYYKALSAPDKKSIDAIMPELKELMATADKENKTEKTE